MFWRHVHNCLRQKIFIYLAQTVFIAGNVDEFLVHFLTRPWCLLCLPMELWPVYVYIYILCVCASLPFPVICWISCHWLKKKERNHWQTIKKRVHFCLTFLDVDLLICKHQGPSCCTRKMEESYQIAVKRETLHNIQSYSYELEHLISGHSDAFQGKSQDKGAKLGLDGVGLKYWVVVERREKDLGIPCLMGCALAILYILYLPLPGTDPHFIDPLISLFWEEFNTKNNLIIIIYL